jgi:hypothetical protein
VKIIQNHYPERLERALLVNVPFIFSAAWAVLCPFIKPAVRDKVRFVEDDTQEAVLQEFASASILPSKYGGDCAQIAVPNIPAGSVAGGRQISRGGRQIDAGAAVVETVSLDLDESVELGCGGGGGGGGAMLERSAPAHSIESEPQPGSVGDDIVLASMSSDEDEFHEVLPPLYFGLGHALSDHVIFECHCQSICNQCSAETV